MDDTVTVVLVYQNSQPWLEVALRSLLAYSPGHPAEYLLVENPCTDASPAVASDFALKRSGVVILKHEQDKDRYGGGQNHADALMFAMEYVTTRWTLFLDADVVFLRDDWLRDLMRLGADMAGPPAFSNLYDYSIPHAHPSLLLFRTNLCRPPYWESTLRPTPNLPLAHPQYRDTCIAFTERVGRDPANTLYRLPLTKWTHDNTDFYRIANIAAHMVGTSNLRNRPGKYSSKSELLSMPEVRAILDRTQPLGRGA